MAEEGANAVRSLGQATHVVDDSLLELRLAARQRLGGDHLLDVAVLEPAVAFLKAPHAVPK